MKIVECPECYKRLNSQGLGGHMFIVHKRKIGIRQDIKSLESRLEKLRIQVGIFEARNEDLRRKTEILREELKALCEILMRKRII